MKTEKECETLAGGATLLPSMRKSKKGALGGTPNALEKRSSRKSFGESLCFPLEAWGGGSGRGKKTSEKKLGKTHRGKKGLPGSYA